MTKTAPADLKTFTAVVAITRRYHVTVQAPTQRHAEGVIYGMTPAAITEHPRAQHYTEHSTMIEWINEAQP